MKWSILKVMSVSTMLIIASLAFNSHANQREGKYVKIYGNKSKSLNKDAFNRDWFFDGGAHDSDWGFWNFHPSLELYFDNPKTIDDIDDKPVLTYGLIDKSTIYKIYNSFILKMEKIAENKYKVHTKDFGWNDEEDFILTYDPVSDTMDINGETYWPVSRKETPDGILGEITAGNVNFRSGPAVTYPNMKFYHLIYNDEGKVESGSFCSYGGNKGNRVIICDDQNHPDWYHIFLPRDNYYAWVSKKYCSPITTEGFPRTSPEEIYIHALSECPFDDELGCWEPFVNVYFIFADNQCVYIDSYQNTISFGDVKDGVIYFDIAAQMMFSSSEDPGNHAHINKDGFKMSVGRNATIYNRTKIEATKDWNYLPFMNVFTPESIAKMRRLIKIHGLATVCDDIVLVEDLKAFDNRSVSPR